ncbi:hypothetical protein LRS13_13840 [Svornostia abyssi]|uniref:Uncharacterized protein n=1 Tax=Svornostia abyssi TaxID=2898438 RepID=A0ABY5PB41_9ACTN|nr:hypothetical protein LRS13_13840 [Parviterribacteraceae bacterium J379]
MSSDTVIASILTAAMVAVWGPKILLAYVALFGFLLIACGLARGAEWLREGVRRPPAPTRRIDDDRDAAVRDLIALRRQAVHEMVELSREDFIEGTAREVGRR